MRQLSTVIQQYVRSIKNRKTATNIDPVQKIKFSQEQITQMGQYRMKTGARNVKDLFKQKISEKLQQEYLKKQKDQMKKPIEQPTNQLHQQEERAPNLEKNVKPNLKEKFKTFKIYKHLDKLKAFQNIKSKQAQEKAIVPQQDRLAKLSRVRLIQQYLPYEYMKRVQKIFHKYDQTQMRDIAFNFSNLMRLRYNEQKIDYEAYPNLKFDKLEEKLPFHRRVQQIYLTSKEKALEGKQQSTRKIDTDPIESEIKYSQNLTVSYLLNRVPRTYAVAFRTLSQIKKMYPLFKPTSFMDFGAGLSSGSVAFIETYGDTGSVFSVQPSGKMRKLAKYLTDYTKISHFQTLAQLSSQIRQVDIAYCAYVLNQIRSQLISVYLQSLYSKVKTQGFLVLVQYGNPFGARLIHQARKWALTKKIRIVAPCPHMMKCPLSSGNHWCHFDQPAGMLPKQVFGKLPNDNSIKLQKYSYLIIQKLDQNTGNQNVIAQPVEPNETKDWDRVLFPLMRKGGHYIYTLCTKNGRFQKRITGKSHGPEYKQGRKLRWGDFWRFSKRIPNRYRKERRTGRRLW